MSGLKPHEDDAKFSEFSKRAEGGPSRVGSSSKTFPATLGNDARRVHSALCTRMRIVSLGSDLSSRRQCAEKYVTVMPTVSGCDVTTVQLHYTGSTSTPPRVARLCQIREASLVALRKISKIYACSHVSIVRLVQSIILVSRDLY